MKIVKWALALGILNTLLIAGFVYKIQSVAPEAAAYVNVASLYEAFDMTQELGERYDQYVSKQGSISDSLQLEALRIEQLIKSGTLTEEDKIIQTMQLLQGQMAALTNSNMEMKSDFEQQIWTQINAYIKEFGEDHTYQVILGATGQGSLMYAEQTLDITEKMTDFINAKYNGRI